MIATLVKRPIRVFDAHSLNESLAHEAALLLGYHGLRKELGLDGPLGHLLHEMEIEPFTPESVKAYQEEIFEAEKTKVTANFSKLDSAHWVFDREVKWVRLPIAGHLDKIPPFAINTACEIARKMPQVGIFIETFHDWKRYQDRVVEGDPFPYVELGEENYYIRCWDEPSFEAKQL